MSDFLCMHASRYIADLARQSAASFGLQQDILRLKYFVTHGDDGDSSKYFGLLSIQGFVAGLHCQHYFGLGIHSTLNIRSLTLRNWNVEVLLDRLHCASQEQIVWRCKLE